MSEEAKSEVKTGWSWSYILLTIVISILTGIVGYTLKYFFDPPVRKTITITEETEGNLLNIDDSVEGDIVTTYRRKNDPNQTIHGYWCYRTTVRNTGDVGVQDVNVVIASSNPHLQLVKCPKITTDPQDLLIGQGIKRGTATSSTHKDEWKIALLNRNESITFEYVAYCTKPQQDCKFITVVRKKDWTVNRDKNSTGRDPDLFLDRSLVQLRGRDILFLLVLFALMQMILSLYLRLFVNLRPVRRFLDGLGSKQRQI